MTAHALRGLITTRPTLGGVVFTDPYVTSDIITNVSAQLIDVPRLTHRNRRWFAVNPGQRVTVPPPLTAADLPAQVWQLVGLRLLSVTRLRDQRVYDGDNTPAQFVPLHRRPELRWRFDEDRSVLVVWRDSDDITAQTITVNNLTPQVAFALQLTAVADVGQPAEFAITQISTGLARFVLEPEKRTHAGIIAQVAVAV